MRQRAASLLQRDQVFIAFTLGISASGTHPIYFLIFASAFCIPYGP